MSKDKVAKEPKEAKAGKAKAKAAAKKEDKAKKAVAKSTTKGKCPIAPIFD